MEKREIWAVWIGGAALITPLLSVVATSHIAGDLIPHSWWVSVAGHAMGYFANLVVAAWLFLEARRSGASPWVWAMLGLVFSLVAAVLFFLLRVLETRSTTHGHGEHAA